MKEHSELYEGQRLEDQPLVEVRSRPVKLEKEAFVDPVNDGVEDEGERVEDREAGAVHQARPQVREQLGVNVMA